MFLTEKVRTDTILACRFCPMCNIADGVAQVTRHEANSPRGRAAILFALEHGLLQWDERVGDIMFRTVNDGLLREWCVGHYDHEELVIDARSRLVAKGLAPEEVRSYLGAAKRDMESGSLLSTLSNADVRVDQSADLVLYAGRFVRREAIQALVAVGRLLNRFGVPFAVLDSEPDCGFDAYMLGDFEQAKVASQRLCDALHRIGCRTLVVIDSTSLRMLTTRTERFGGSLKGISVQYYTRFLAEQIERQSLVISRPAGLSVTYHDASSLCRYADETESPRQLLNALTERVVEMATHGKRASSDGAEGLLYVLDSTLARDIARHRLDEARDTGADLLVTACPRSAMILKSAARDGDPQVTCLAEFADTIVTTG